MKKQNKYSQERWGKLYRALDAVAIVSIIILLVVVFFGSKIIEFFW